MRGEVDFAASVRERVAMLAGLDAAALDEVAREVTLAPGARTLIRTLRHLGFRCGIVSGGLPPPIDAPAADLWLHFAAANALGISRRQQNEMLSLPPFALAVKQGALPPCPH